MLVMLCYSARMHRAPVDTGAADPLDDDALITWEDAEWQ